MLMERCFQTGDVKVDWDFADLAPEETLRLGRFQVQHSALGRIRARPLTWLLDCVDQTQQVGPLLCASWSMCISIRRLHGLPSSLPSQTEATVDCPITPSIDREGDPSCALGWQSALVHCNDGSRELANHRLLVRLSY
jgi:hypothetical protein